MSWVEAVAAILGLVCVALAVRRSTWNFAFGIGSTALLGTVFYDARLYSDMLLQGFFVVVNLYGWRDWHRSQARTGEVIVEALDTRARLLWAGACIAVTLVWGAAMHRYTDASYPWPDAGIAIVSVAAQLLMARRKLENWYLWIAVDIASIPLYAAKGLWLTTALYAVYLAMACWGLADWRRVRRPVGPVVA